MNLPPPHQSFLDHALPRLQADPRILGVAGAGSIITGTMDQYSDLDLVVVSPSAAVARERRAILQGLGPLLVSRVLHGQLPRGVRRLETRAPQHLEAMKKTVASYDRDSCISATRPGECFCRQGWCSRGGH